MPLPLDPNKARQDQIGVLAVTLLRNHEGQPWATAHPAVPTSASSPGWGRGGNLGFCFSALRRHLPSWLALERGPEPAPCSSRGLLRAVTLSPPFAAMSLAILVLRLVVGILVFPMYLLNLLGMWNWICKKCFPYFLSLFTVTYNEQMASKKKELFSNLQEFAGPSGKLSLLEMGCGTGANFKFYPPGCRVTCVDPNPSFEKFLFKSVSENRQLQFERFVVAAGENMSQVADGSMDVVVCTLVLCSVKNQEKILREVCRVLRPVSDR